MRKVVRLACCWVLVGWAAAQPAELVPTETATVFYEKLTLRGGQVSPVAVRQAVDALVMAATGKPDVASAWRSLVRPRDRVGIKVSTAPAPVAGTHPAVVEAVAEGLVAAGVSPDRIVIWDRKWDDVSRAGYGQLARRFVVTSTDRAGGYHAKEFVTAAMMGKLIKGDREFDARKTGSEQVSSKSFISNVLVSGVDKVVHVPALTDHLSSGLNGSLSGMVLDNLDNWRRLARPPFYGDPFLPELFADPRLGGKVVFTILDALRVQYAGGPFPGAQYVVNHGAVYASRDPVAIDAVGADLLNGFRQRAGMPTLKKQTAWLASAEALGLGVGTRERIRLIRPWTAVPAQP